MKREDQETLIAYRFEQAQEALADANLLLEKARLRGAINRLYYAAFYGACAMALTKGKEFSKHSGVIGFFDKEFVKPGVLPKDFSRTLHAVFDQRQEGDYLPFSSLGQDEVESLSSQIQAFVNGIHGYLKANGWIK